MGKTDLAGKNGKVDTGKGIYELTKNLYFADYDTQKDFYTTFSKALTDQIISLKSQGLYTGVMENKDYAAKSIAVYPFFIGNNESRTSFGRHVFIDKSEVKIEDQKNIEQFVKEKVKSKFSITSKWDGHTYTYPDHSGYINKSNEFLDKYDDLYQAAEKEDIKETKETIATYKKQIKEYEAELKKFGLLDEAVKMKERINILKERSAEAIEAVTEALTSGGDPTEMMAKVQEKTALSSKLQAEIKEVETTLDKTKYKDAYEKRHEYDIFNRNKRDDLYQIEKLEERRVKNSEKIGDKRKVIALIKEYIGKIGNIFEYNISEESEDLDDDSQEYVFNYTKVSSEKVVLYGVNWDAYSDVEHVRDIEGLTLGNITLHLAKVVGEDTTNLFSFLAPIREDREKRGKKNRVEFIDTNKSYEYNWNKYLQTIDTGRLEERYFLTGSLLKGFVAAYQNGYSGTIIKYNTDNHKVRIAIELAEEAKKALEARYSEDTALSYPIFFDTNPENTQLFIKDYLWKAYNDFQGEGETSTNINKAKGFFSEATRGKIIFEISESGASRAAVGFGLDDLEKAYQAEQIGIKQSHEELFSKMKATFMFSAKRTAEGFLTLANIISESEGLYTSDIEALKDEEVKSESEGFTSRYSVKNQGMVTSRVEPFVDFFPTNLLKFQEKMEDSSWGTSMIYDYAYSVKISFELFEAITRYLHSARKNFIMCTSSAWYEASDANFIMEQFDDDIQTPEEVDGGESTEFVSPLTEEVQEKVDTLINDLMISVSEGITELV